ncbi:P-loop containing nucleoside triphosphate hydrolase protein [Lipomyces chichibuensis]|uniref:P-loop containing nucleoside triphosphate hydrolase protein n=1 Tax=Lipomyces chichibuensis TaxID=1546026 RepID=UPI0033441911
MSSHTAIVSFAPLRSSLVNLPPSVTRLLGNSYVPAQNVIVEITATSRDGSSSKGYAGWTGFSSTKHDFKSGSNFVEIDPLFAKSLNISEGTKASLNFHVSPPAANTIFLEPATPSDWDTVELHAQFLEMNMLAQIRAVSFNQPLTIHLSSATTATLVLSKIEPPLKDGFKFAKIAPNAEVIVAPKVKKPVASANGTPSKKKNFAGSVRKTSDTSSNYVLLKAVTLPHSYFDDDIGFASENSRANSKLSIYVDSEAVYSVVKSSQHAMVSVVKPSMLKQPAPAPTPDGEVPGNEQHRAAIKVAVDVVLSDAIPVGYVGLSPRLGVALGVPSSISTIVKIEQASKPLSRYTRKLFVIPFADAAKSDRNQIRIGGCPEDRVSNNELRELLEYLGVLSSPISNNLRLPNVPNTILNFGGMIEFEQSDGWILPPYTNITIELKNEVVFDVDIEVQDELAENQNLCGVTDSLCMISKAVRRGSGVLLTGASGSGKSAMLERIRHELSEDLIYNFRVSCSDFAEERVPVVKDAIQKWFAEASWYSPSVVIFEDINKLMPAEMEHMDSTRTRQLAEVFIQAAKATTDFRSTSLLATASSKEAVHSLLVTSHIFDEGLHLKAPDKSIRKQIIAESLRRQGISDLARIDVLEVADNTEGFFPGDIMTLSERVKHEALIRTLDGDGTVDIALQQHDFDHALKDFVPASLRGVNLQKSTVAWKDIGGLKETKQVLLETLEWPTKYAPIFANCPLRLRSGLLLYGYPGCGKTFLASAVAHECGLNFISIKGPEILNKYIGASEKSVRDLFERAQAAKPCVLFFDEFDSIAPKRGHDSTGVTDRVVNQMLTQMDGAEGLDGVYVLAATSRPDLIDSALLRPGRIDKTLLCDMPSVEDRLDIIQAMSRKMELAEDIELDDIAHKTEGFSGADLQALMYNAHLAAIHEIVDERHSSSETSTVSDKSLNLEYFQLLLEFDKKNVDGTNEGKLDMFASYKLDSLLNKSSASQVPGAANSNIGQHVTKNVAIKPHHMAKSLASTRPSISVKERERLAAIYHEFIFSRSGDMPSGTASTDVGGRATLM